MTLLLVDDELHTIEAIRRSVNWQALGIGQVLSARNLASAQKVFEKGPIDILLCDIEMPQGSGLDLVTWVKARYPDTHVLFLTCHADFRYAQEALRLGGADYLLKPLPYDELEQILAKAVETHRLKTQSTRLIGLGQRWQRQEPALRERFWTDVLGGTLAPSAEGLAAAARDRELVWEPELRWNVVLVTAGKSVQGSPLPVAELVRLAQERVAGDGGTVLVRAPQTLAVLVPKLEASPDTGETLQQSCADLVLLGRVQLHGELHCVVSPPVPPEACLATLEAMELWYGSQVAPVGEVSHWTDPGASAPGLSPEVFDRWALYLKEGQKDLVLKEAQNRIGGLGGAVEGRTERLWHFCQDTIQMVLSVLGQAGVQAHSLFPDWNRGEGLETAVQSVRNCGEWTAQVITKAAELLEHQALGRTDVERACRFIAANLNRNLTREEVAGSISRNPDHLSRIFKKHFGMNVTDYLIQKRMEKAEELLMHSHLTVSAVGNEIGYANLSHFARMFKLRTGLSPLEYRRKHSPQTVLK